jgi:RNA-directed DNA polymerase
MARRMHGGAEHKSAKSQPVWLGKGGWAIAQSPILGTTITLERLRKRGYESIESYYQKVSPMFNEPLYTRTVRTVV